MPPVSIKASHWDSIILSRTEVRCTSVPHFVCSLVVETEPRPLPTKSAITTYCTLKCALSDLMHCFSSIWLVGCHVTSNKNSLAITAYGAVRIATAISEVPSSLYFYLKCELWAIDQTNATANQLVAFAIQRT